MCCQDVPDARAIRQIRTRYRTLAPLMDERLRRQWAASEAQSLGRGGVSAVSRATGMSRNTARRGMTESRSTSVTPAGYQQVEQDRTSHVLPHHSELARPTARRPRGHRQLDRRRDYTHRSDDT